MPNVMAALLNVGGALCSTPQTLVDAYYSSAVQCNAAKMRNPLKLFLLGCPKRANRSQPLVGLTAELHHIVKTWGRHWCLTSFFPIVDTCLSCKDISRQSCAMVPRWWIFGNFWGPAFPASRVKHISDLHSKFAVGSLGSHHNVEVW